MRGGKTPLGRNRKRREKKGGLVDWGGVCYKTEGANNCKPRGEQWGRAGTKGRERGKKKNRSTIIDDWKESTRKLKGKRHSLGRQKRYNNKGE